MGRESVEEPVKKVQPQRKSRRNLSRTCEVISAIAMRTRALLEESLRRRAENSLQMLSSDRNALIMTWPARHNNVVDKPG